MEKFKLIALVLIIAVSLAACTKGNEPQPETVSTKKPLPPVSDKSKPMPPVIFGK